MVLIFFTFLAFSILLISKNYRSRNILWFYFMLIGFYLSFIGLALYNEYISMYSEDKLFGSVSNFIWMADYFLKLDITKSYRLMNIGTSLYIFGAVSFPLSYLNNQKVKHAGLIACSITPLLMIVLYDPKIISIIYGYNDSIDYTLVKKQVSETYQLMNTFFNLLIKIHLSASIALFVYVLKMIIPIMRKRYKYMIIGIVPIHVLFLLLFYWFPNHNIAYRRVFLLSSISVPYNQALYDFITFVGVISVVLLIYAMWRYNIFEINIRKDRVNFQRQMDTAQVGLRVFSHSIKNQMIAIKLLTEQLENNHDDTGKSALSQEIINICNNSIEKLGASSKTAQVVRLRYSSVNINELIKKIVLKHEKINKNISFLSENKSELSLYLDEEEFEKVMDNLLINAIEASGDRRKLHIKTIVEEKDNYGVITVEDNGIGIERKNLKKVFEPFFSTKPMSSNWGIGLSQCQKVIEAFGGDIEIESKENEGTKVNIFIPKR